MLWRDGGPLAEEPQSADVRSEHWEEKRNWLLAIIGAWFCLTPRHSHSSVRSRPTSKALARWRALTIGQFRNLFATNAHWPALSAILRLKSNTWHTWTSCNWNTYCLAGQCCEALIIVLFKAYYDPKKAGSRQIWKPQAQATWLRCRWLVCSFHSPGSHPHSMLSMGPTSSQVGSSKLGMKVHQNYQQFCLHWKTLEIT